MQKLRQGIRSYLLLVLLVVVAVGLAGVLVHFSGQNALQTTIAFPPGTAIVIAPQPDLLLTPAAPVNALDPAVLSLPPAQNSVYSAGNLELSGAISVGMYLPRTGNTAFMFAEPTLPPTPLPYPTSPPLPLPALAPLPTIVPAEEPRTLVYTADNCAPAGVPVDGILTQRYHYYHSGIDIGVPSGTPVIATHSGTVTYADWSEIGYGYLVIIQNGRFITYYAHNTAFNVSVGTQVGKGSIVAWSGSTGNSSGPHVHYETRLDDVPQDPLSFESQGFLSC